MTFRVPSKSVDTSTTRDVEGTSRPDGAQSLSSGAIRPGRATRRRRVARRRASRREPGPVAVHLQYFLFRASVGLLSLLPLRVALRLGEAIALLIYVLDRPHRRVGLINLAIAFPHRPLSERRRILRSFWLNLGRMTAEGCHMGRLTPETVSQWVTFEDPAYWRSVLEKHGRTGALVLTGHFGNWELFAHAHGLYGYPVHLVYRALKNPLIDDFINQRRRSSGTSTVRKSTAGTNIVRALRQGAILVIPADQNSTRGMGIFVDFFGVPASTNTGLARLAMRTGLPVYPAFLVRQGRGPRHRIVLGSVVPIAQTGDRNADLRENTQRFARVLEDMIARYPDHWLWVHKRWKTRPPGEPRIY